MTGRRMHTSHSSPTPPGSAPDHKLQKPSKESLAYFSHLAPLVLFFFTKKQSQKGEAWHNGFAPLPKYAPAQELMNR